MSRSLRVAALAASASFVLLAARGLVACVGSDPTPGGGSPTDDGGGTPPGSGDGGPGTDGAGGDAPGSTDLSVDPKTFDVPPGGKVSLKLHGAPGATVTVATQADTLADGGAPPGTSPLVAPASVTLDAIGNGSVDVSAAADAAQGRAKVTFTVGGVSQGVTGRIIGKSGELDLFFGGGLGYVDLEPQAGGTVPSSVLVQPDGKVLVGGNTNIDMFVARLDANGVLDPSFGTGGSVIHGTAQSPKIALLADGSIVVDADPGAPNPPTMWLLSSAGVFSDAWGGQSGYPQSSMGSAASGVITTGGAIFLGGTDALQKNSVVRKYFPDAGRDTTWGTNGSKSTPESGMTLVDVSAFTVDSSGLLWATGGAQTTTGSTPYALDLRFVANGGADIDAPQEQGQGLAIAAQGTKAVIAAQDPAGKGFLFRNGGMGVPLDPSFGDSTTHHTDLGTTIPSSIAVDAAGRILVAGGGRTTFDVLRFDPDGHADGTFGNAGVGSTKGVAIALAVSGSWVYVVGDDDAAATGKARVARFWN